LVAADGARSAYIFRKTTSKPGDDFFALPVPCWTTLPGIALPKSAEVFVVTEPEPDALKEALVLIVLPKSFDAGFGEGWVSLLQTSSEAALEADDIWLDFGSVCSSRARTTAAARAAATADFVATADILASDAAG
jgi:hypothetical protein